MIQIHDKHDCCGCAACVQICPKKCISFLEDEQGFRYPKVDEDLCISCNLCERVCPVLNQAEVKKPMKVYAAQNLNEEVRLKSSSGGIFTMLAESVIDEGGVVFGVQFDDNWEVEHAYTETKEGLSAFRGSKYLQSRTGDTFRQARDFLKEGRKVLYSGTSCQIAGLKKFLRKEYDNLITVDVVCHGAPSPLVWRTYLESVLSRPKGVVGKNSVLSSLNVKPVITGISFRDKMTGWKKFGFVLKVKSAFEADKNTVLSSINSLSDDEIILHETLDKNLYMQIFLKNLCLRPSCSVCPAKSGKGMSDITLADYWGIHNHYPLWDDDKGTSLVLINTEKGFTVFHNLNCRNIETSYEEGLMGNPCIEHSVVETFWVSDFWTIFHKSKLLEVASLLSKMKPKYYVKYINKIKFLIRIVLIKLRLWK